MSTATATTLIDARWIIPVVPEGVVLENHSIALDGEKILAIIPPEARQQWQAEEVISLGEHVLMPGLVNLHGHSAMTLLRGVADDLPLMDWLQNHIWPAEGRLMCDEFVYDGSVLGMAEMLRSGTTTINDMYFFHGAVARAGLTTGMRTVVGCTVIEFPTAYASTAAEHLSKALAERSEFVGEKLVSFALAPHAPYSVSDATFREVLAVAEKEDMLIHCHIQETQGEVETSLKEHQQRPLARLHRLGLLSSRLIAAHMVAADEADITLAAQCGISIAHNPTSNMKLASGIAPISRYLAAGINVGIGTDGSASNNKLDMLAETRMAALLAKVGTLDPTVVPAATALRMATLNGAQALGMADKIGSLEVGKCADMIAINLNAVETAPAFDPISHVVYAAGREQVEHVWVNGRHVLKQRQLATIDHAAWLQRAAEWRHKVVGA